MPEEADEVAFRAFGRTLVASDGTPLGFSAVYFKPNGQGDLVAIIIHYGGPGGYFMRKYLPMILRGMTECLRELKDMGVTHAYCVCDRKIPDAEKLIAWFGGELVPEAQDPNGDIYVLHWDKLRLLQPKGRGAAPVQAPSKPV